MNLRGWLLASAVSVLAVAATVPCSAATQAVNKQNNTAFLSDIHGAKALEWVRAQNNKTTSELEKDKRYQEFYDKTLSVLQAPDRLPSPDFFAGGIWNFWQDAQHPHGIWRAATLESYLSSDPSWQTKIDFDALSKQDHKNWVFQGTSCLNPADEKCLIALSDGGEDAVTLREFNTKTGQFVKENGFEFSRSKQNATWLDDNTILLARDWDGKGTDLTASGYPFVVKKVERGQSPAQAQEVYRGQPSDISVETLALTDGQGHRLVLVSRRVTFFEVRFAVLDGNTLHWLSIPEKADVQGLLNGRLIFSVNEDWKREGLPTIPAGSVVSVDPENTVQSAEIVFTPSATQAVEDIGVTKNAVLISFLDNVRGRAARFKTAGAGKPWQSEQLNLPDMASVHVAATSTQSDEAFVSVESYIKPRELWLVQGEEKPRQVKAAPARFNASDLETEQLWATSTDGVKVPYFIVHRRNMPMNGQNPTLMTAYGGFQVSYTPVYAPETGLLWLERGGVYVVANIRGGGEFGPKWHEVARKSGRMKAYDDFAAVGKDLIHRGITSTEHLGIRGRSNGGLLAGAEMVQHPDLWKAVIIGVPLLDMEHFETMSAGASWVGEYGSMSVPSEAEFLRKISPLQSLKADVTYPVPFIFTSTSDDRVGPVHARRFAEKLQSMGKKFYYYEDIQGGHSGTVNAPEVAQERALEFVYLSQFLMDQP